MQRILPKPLLSLGSLSLLLVALEIAARFALEATSRQNTIPVPASIRMPSPFPGLPYLHRPHGVGVHHFGSDPHGYFDPGAALSYRLNSLGLPGAETTREKHAARGPGSGPLIFYLRASKK